MSTLPAHQWDQAVAGFRDGMAHLSAADLLDLQILLIRKPVAACRENPAGVAALAVFALEFEKQRRVEAGEA